MDALWSQPRCIAPIQAAARVYFTRRRARDLKLISRLNFAMQISVLIP